MDLSPNNLRVLESKSDAAEVITAFAKDADQYQSVVLIAYKKDRAQYMATSTMSAEERCFLKCFFDSVIHRWFSGTQDLPVA